MSFLSEVIPLSQIRGAVTNERRTIVLNYDLSGLTEFTTSVSGTTVYAFGNNTQSQNGVVSIAVNFSQSLNVNSVSNQSGTMTVSVVGSQTGVIHFNYTLTTDRSTNTITLVFNTTALTNPNVINGFTCFSINGRP